MLEMSGGAAFEACLRTLAPFGRLVTFGIASREPNQVATGHLMRPLARRDRLLAHAPGPAAATRSRR